LRQVFAALRAQHCHGCPFIRCDPEDSHPATISAVIVVALLFGGFTTHVHSTKDSSRIKSEMA